ncbi:MFS transporter, partial [Chloroflexota bacterium]
MLTWLKGNSENDDSSPGAHRKERLLYGWVVIAGCFIILTTAMATRYSFGVFFRALEEDFGLTRAATSGIFSVHMLLCPAVAVLGGWALDRYGPRVVVLITGFLTGLSLLLASQAGNVWHLYISYSLLLALGTGAIFSLLMATASRWFIRKRGMAVGIVGSGAGAAVVVSAPIAAYLISSYGWRT